VLQYSPPHSVFYNSYVRVTSAAFLSVLLGLPPYPLLSEVPWTIDFFFFVLCVSVLFFCRKLGLFVCFSVFFLAAYLDLAFFREIFSFLSLRLSLPSVAF